MQEQTDGRLLKILKDGDEYADGVADAARSELISRGFSTDDLISFAESNDQLEQGSQGVENSPLDAIWMHYRKSQTATGMLLLVVFLLIFSILKTLLVYAVLHYRYAQEFSFEVSLLQIFLPMALSAFSAYTIWKLNSAGWFTGLLFGYGTLVRIAIELIILIQSARLIDHPSQVWLNEGIKVALDGFIAVFVISQLSRLVHRHRLRIPDNLGRLTLVALPVLSLLVVTLVYIFWI